MSNDSIELIPIIDGKYIYMYVHVRTMLISISDPISVSLLPSHLFDHPTQLMILYYMIHTFIISLQDEIDNGTTLSDPAKDKLIF